MDAKDLIIVQLREIIERQAALIEALQAEVAALKAELAGVRAEAAALRSQVALLKDENARLRKNSSNSSKPPSSDIVKPPRPKGRRKKRRPGGQPGHRRHERQPFAPDEIDRTQDHRLESCPSCGGPVRNSRKPPRILQQAEIPPILLEVTEHRAHAVWCPHCRAHHWTPLPPEVKAGGLIGPRLSALMAYLKGRCHASYTTVRTFCRDVLGLKVSTGQLVKVIAKGSRAMEDAYNELLADLPGQQRLNVDETGHKDRSKPHWTWCFRSDLYTLFHIDASRGSKVLVNLLGEEFNGVLGCDYFSAYRKYMGNFNVVVQFCLAHLIRDVKFLTELPDAAAAAYGQRLLKGLRRLFGVIHRREAMRPRGFHAALVRAQKAILAAARKAPAHRKAKNLARRFQFITTPGIEPTNNLAEQAIRFVVIDRMVTQGTRSEMGQRWCERIWTAIATCARHGRSVFEYLHQSILCHFQGLPTPSLLPPLRAGP